MRPVLFPARLVAALACACATLAHGQIDETQKYRILQKQELRDTVGPLLRAGLYDEAVDHLLARGERYRRELGAGDPLAVFAVSEAASVEVGRGRFSAAIRILESASNALEGVENARSQQLDIGAQLGGVYLLAGSYRQAIAKFEAAIAEPRDEYPSRAPFKGIYEAAMGLGDLALARAAIARFRAAKFRVSQIPFDLRWARISEARILHREGRLEEAVALAERENPLFVGINETVAILGILLEAGRLEEAQKRVSDLLQFEGRSLPTNHFAWARIYDAKARLLAAQSQLPAAILAGKLSVDALQRTSVSFEESHADLRRSFLEESAGPYRRLAGWLVAEGRLGEAQAVLDLLKGEELVQVLRGSPGTNRGRVEFTAIETRAVAPLLDAQGRAAALGAELESIRQRARLGLEPEDETRRKQLQSALGEANRRFRASLESLLQEVAKEDALRNQEIGEKNLLALKTLQGTLRELGPGVVAVHYVVTPDRLHAIVTTPQAQVVRSTNVATADLNRRVFELRRRLEKPGLDPLPPAQALYDLALKPVEEDLRAAGAKQLVLSLDGTLRYAPFAALHDGKEYVAQRYALSLLTPAGQVSLKDRPKKVWTVGAFGVTRAMDGLDALPSVRFELESIAGGRGAGSLPGEIRLDEQFDLPAMRQAIDKPFPVIHVASHFVFRAGAEDESFLLLGSGERMTLRDIKDRDLDLNGVDLLALSACDTGIGGGRDPTGREIEGLGALAQRQGAKAVMATIWKVADESTGHFMRRFYAAKSGDGLTKAEAVRRVQVEMLENRASVTPSGADYSHPFYWAPFVLMGNWL